MEQREIRLWNFSENNTLFKKKLNKKDETEDETGIDKGYEKGNELEILKKYQVCMWIRGTIPDTGKDKTG